MYRVHKCIGSVNGYYGDFMVIQFQSKSIINKKYQIVVIVDASDDAMDSKSNIQDMIQHIFNYTEQHHIPFRLKIVSSGGNIAEYTSPPDEIATETA